MMRRWSTAVSGPQISRALELIGKVRRCCPVQTLVHENSELALDPLWVCEPMQLPKERSMWSNLNEENTSCAAEFMTD